MPLPAESVSRAETTALDQEAAAMVDDLESSLAASLPKRRSSSAITGKAGESSSQAEAAEEGEAEDGQGQGLVEPSLLVAASAGLGAASSLPALLPLWDYLLVRQDKHFGYVRAYVRFFVSARAKVSRVHKESRRTSRVDRRFREILFAAWQRC